MGYKIIMLFGVVMDVLYVLFFCGVLLFGDLFFKFGIVELCEFGFVEIRYIVIEY